MLSSRSSQIRGGEKQVHALVTGGAGFIGSHLAEALLARGYRVTALDNLSTGRIENVAHLMSLPAFRFVRESVTNEAVVDRLVGECDLVFHLAAAVGVELIVSDPIQVIETNVLGAHGVLKAAARYGTRVLIASTSEIYGKNERVPFREDDDRVLGSTTKARWIYSTSKAVDEFLGLAYHRKIGLPVVVFRLFNTVGPRQTGRYGMVVPRFVQQALRGEPLTVFGDGGQSRCFCDVADAVRAIVALAECPLAAGQVFNVGSAHEVTILELANKVLDVVHNRPAKGDLQSQAGAGPRAATSLESSIRIVPYDDAYGPGFEDMRRRVPNTSKIRELVGWEPRVPLEETLRRMVAFFGQSG